MDNLSGMSVEELAAVVYPILFRRKTGGVELDYEQAQLALTELVHRADVGTPRARDEWFAKRLAEVEAERDRYERTLRVLKDKLESGESRADIYEAVLAALSTQEDAE